MKGLLKLVPRYVQKQSRRAALTALGITLAIALLCATGVVGASIRQTMVDQALDLTGDYHAILSDLDAAQVVSLGDVEGIDAAGSSLPLGAHYLDNLFITVEGFDAAARDLFGLDLAAGRFPENEGEIALEGWVLDALGLGRELGQVLSLPLNHSYVDAAGAYQEIGFEARFTLVGILHDIPAARLTGASLGLVAQDTIHSLLPAEHVRYHAFVRAARAGKVHETMAGVQRALGLGDKQISYNDHLLGALGEGASGNWPILLLGAVVVAATVATIYNAFQISVLERLQQFGLLRAVGATSGQLRLLVVAEAALLLTVAIPLGLLTGVGAAALLTQSLGMLDAMVARLVVPPAVLGAAAGLGLLATLVSALLPARVAGRVPPLEAMAHHRTVLDGRVRHRGAAWGRILGITGRLAYQNVWRNRKRSLVTIFSLGIGVVLFGVFTTWASSADASSIVAGLLFGDYALKAHTPERGVGFSPEVARAAAAIPGVDRVYALQTDYGNRLLLPASGVSADLLGAGDTVVDGDTASLSITLLGYGPDELDLARPYLETGEIDPAALASTPSALVVDPSGSTGLQVGDTVTIRHTIWSETGLETEDTTYTVAGILRDVPLAPPFRATGPTVVLERAQYAACAGTDLFKQIDVLLAPGADEDAVEAQLSALADTIPQGDVMSLRQETARLEAEKRQMMWLVYGLVAVVTVIGVVNIVNTITSNLILRTREFGMLRAVGITGRQLRRMTRLEGLFYGLLSAAWSLPAGGILAYLFFLAARSEMTYLDWSLPWAMALPAALVCVTVGVAATLPPMRRISRIEVVDALRSIV